MGRRKARLEAGRYIIEGPVPIGELLHAGAQFEELYVDLDQWAAADDRSPLRSVVHDADASGVPVWGLSGTVFASVSDTRTPQGALASVVRSPATLDEVASGLGPVVVLVDVSDPGNAGTLVRAAEAAGCSGVIFAGTSTDAFGPKAVRAAAGSIVRLPIAECVDVGQALETLSAGGRMLVATVVDAETAPDEIDLTGPVAVLIGSEAHGLPIEIASRCDQRVTIPMNPSVESMNAAVAGAVILFESARQRRRTQGTTK